MEKYVADDEVVLCLMGLRWVRKLDTQYLSSRDEFCLEWSYKGQEKKHEYKDKEKRDAMYEMARQALVHKDK